MDKATWKAKFDEEYFKRLQDYYKLPWIKRIFKKPPKQGGAR